MFIFNKKLPVTEYVSTSLTGKGAMATKSTNIHNDLDVNPVRLATALAKCIFTRNSGNADAIFETLETYLRLQRMVDKVLSPDFKLRSTYFENLRDFSRTTRLGELAQGINFLMAQDRLGIPVLVDYHGYCRNKGYAKPPKSTPDFVGCASINNYYLLESKGTLSKCNLPTIKTISSRLRKSLCQCDSGEAYLVKEGAPPATRKYGALVSFQYSHSSHKSEIHLCDPENSEEKKSSFDSLSFVQYYYESILRGFMADNSSISLIRRLSDHNQNEIISYKGIDFIRVTTSTENPIMPPYYIFTDRLPEYLDIGISLELLNALARDDISQYFEVIGKVQEAITSYPVLPDAGVVGSDADKFNKTEMFCDGTIAWPIW